MNKTAEKAREGKQIKVLRRIFGKQPLRNVVSKTKELFKNRKTYSIKYMLLSTQNRSGKKRAFEVNGRNYYPLLNPAQREANVKANDFLETVIKRRITKEYDKFLFKRLMLILRTDSEFNDMAKGDMYQYINAIRIESANVAEGEAQPPENQNLRDATNISIYNKYIETEIDPSNNKRSTR